MHLTASALTLGSLATLASASALDNAMARRSFQFPDSVSLARRAVTGAEYQCHASCGYTILDAEEDGYCDSAEWNELLAACLACANEYDMWPDYGEGVEAAAEACGLDATPASAGETTAAAAGTTAAAAETTAAAAETTAAAAETTAAAAETTAVAEESTVAAEETTAAEESVAVSSAAASESVATTASVVVTTPVSNSTSSTPTSSVVEGGAPEFAVSHIVAAGAALMAVAGLM